MKISTVTGASLAAAAAIFILSGTVSSHSASAELSKCATGKICKDSNACKSHNGCS